MSESDVCARLRDIPIGGDADRTDEPLVVGQLPTSVKWDDNNPLNYLYLEIAKATSQTDLTRRLDNLYHKRMWGP